MKATGFHAFGGPEVFEELELPDPHAGPSEVRIKVAAVAVNPSARCPGPGRRRRS